MDYLRNAFTLLPKQSVGFSDWCGSSRADIVCAAALWEAARRDQKPAADRQIIHHNKTFNHLLSFLFFLPSTSGHRHVMELQSRLDGAFKDTSEIWSALSPETRFKNKKPAWYRSRKSGGGAGWSGWQTAGRFRSVMIFQSDQVSVQPRFQKILFSDLSRAFVFIIMSSLRSTACTNLHHVFLRQRRPVDRRVVRTSWIPEISQCRRRRSWRVVIVRLQLMQTSWTVDRYVTSLSRLEFLWKHSSNVTFTCQDSRCRAAEVSSKLIWKQNQESIESWGQ